MDTPTTRSFRLLRVDVTGAAGATVPTSKAFRRVIWPLAVYVRSLANRELMISNDGSR